MLTPAVSEAAGVDKKSLLEWVACGLLPPPLSARGRGIVSKWQQTLQQQDAQQRLAANVFRGVSVLDHAPTT